MRRKNGVDLSTELDKVARSLDRRGHGGLLQAKVNEAWSAIAGPSVSSHTTGAHLRSGELIIYVDSPVWATELSALSEQYRLALNERIGQESVRDVRFSVSRKVSEHQEQDRLEDEAEAVRREDDVPAVALTANERAQIEASVLGIPDEELRETVLRATIADLEWKKGIAAAKRREATRQEA